MDIQLQSNASFRINDLLDPTGTGAAAGVGASGGATGGAPVYLTPDAVMAYCESRLQDVDGQVQKLMEQQQSVSGQQAAIGNLLSQIQTLQNNVDGTGVTKADSANAQKMEQEIEDLVKQMQQTNPGSPEIQQLESVHDTMMATGSGPYTLNGETHSYYAGSKGSPADTPTGQNPPPNINHDTDSVFGTGELKGFSDSLTSVSNSLNSGAELQMIQIQSLMSQRSTAIQLSTNIMQAIDDGTSKIAANVGRTS